MEETVINGVKVRYRKWADDWAVIKEVFYEDVYRVEAIPFGSVVIDLGAHIGTFTLRCAKERGCRVYAYEPCLETFKLLDQNVKLNGLEGKVKIFKQAVGGSCEVRKLYSYPKSYQSATLFRSFFNESNGWKYEEVEVTTLQHVFDDNAIQECEVLKMDIEGAEKEVVSNRWIRYLKKARLILIEWHNYDGHVYAKFLRRIGFSPLLAGTGVPQPKYDPTFARGMLYAKRGN